MPREITHWVLLEQIKKEAKNKNLKNVTACLERHTEAAFLGAIAHDAPYYYRFGGHSFEYVAASLHGRFGENTLKPMKLFAHNILKQDTDKQEMYWAFLIGMLSHIAVDVRFHPMIFYVTGNYLSTDSVKRDKARLRHRIFEVFLDSWMRPKKHFWNKESVQVTIKSLGKDFDILCDTLEREFSVSNLCGEEYNVSLKEGKLWKDSFSHMAIFQSLFCSKVAGFLMNLFSKLTGRNKSIEALFAYQRNSREAFFEEPIKYQNPVTGEEFEEGVTVLSEHSIEDCLGWLIQLEEVINGGEIELLFKAETGKSLNFGLIDVKASDSKYYSENNVQLPGMEAL